MAHGKTLEMRAIERPEPEYLAEHRLKTVWFGKGENARSVTVRDGEWSTYRDLEPKRDRSLTGKARRRARREAKHAEDPS